MKIETVHITTRRPHNGSDPGACHIVYYMADGREVRVTDRDGHLLRYANGEPCKQALLPGDNPRQIAARLGSKFHNETYGDRQRGFYRDLPKIRRAII
jgi:hypothetical protein